MRDTGSKLPFRVFYTEADNRLMTDTPRTPLQALDLAIAACGSRAELARRIGISEQRVYQWFARENGCSVECAPFVVEACGRIVSVLELRPDYEEFWMLVRDQLSEDSSEDRLALAQ